MRSLTRESISNRAVGVKFLDPNLAIARLKKANLSRCLCRGGDIGQPVRNRRSFRDCVACLSG